MNTSVGRLRTRSVGSVAALAVATLVSLSGGVVPVAAATASSTPPPRAGWSASDAVAAVAHGRTPATERGVDSAAAFDAPIVQMATSTWSDALYDTAYANADLTGAGVDVGGSGRLTMVSSTRTYSDPFVNSDWVSPATAMLWLFDLNGDVQPDRYVAEFKYGSYVYAEMYDYLTDAFTCAGTPYLNPASNTYGASFPMSCVGGTDLPSLNWAAMSYIRTVSNAVYYDFVPNSGMVGSVPSSVYRPKVEAGSSYSLQVTGVGGVPSTGVSAVSMNVTVTQPTATGYITVYPCGSLPTASNLNYVANQTVPNAVIAPVDGLGRVCLYTSARTHLIVDVNGWFPTSSNLISFAPQRLLDTRGGGANGQIAPGVPLTAHVAGFAGVPVTGASAVVMNVTVTSPASGGYVTVYPCGTIPNSSNVNFSTGSTVPNLVIAPISANGNVCFATSTLTHLIVDVVGAFPTSGNGFQSFAPERRLDTRASTRLTAGSSLQLALGGGSIPGTGVAAVSLNVTSTGSTTAGYLTVYPCGTVPNASSVNFGAGVTTANAVVAAVTPTSSVCITTSADTHVIVDTSGYFSSGATSYQALTPARVLDTR